MANITKRVLYSLAITWLCTLVSAAPAPSISTPLCADIVPNCSNNKANGYCQDPILSLVMAVECPVTCGRCTGTLYNPPCTDVSLDCANRKSLCTNPLFTILMAEQCALTCGFCTPAKTTSISVAPISTTKPSTTISSTSINTGSKTSTGVSSPTSSLCADIWENCRQSLCDDSSYTVLMTVSCARTCGRCLFKFGFPANGAVDVSSSSASVGSISTSAIAAISTGVPGTAIAKAITSASASIPTLSPTICKDADGYCASLQKIGFCANPIFTTALKKLLCASTCGLC